MYTDSPIEILFGGSFKHESTESLGYLSGMRTDIMETHNSSTLSSMSD